jgi:hypothetical protein
MCMGLLIMVILGLINCGTGIGVGMGTGTGTNTETKSNRNNNSELALNISRVYTSTGKRLCKGTGTGIKSKESTKNRTIQKTCVGPVDTGTGTRLKCKGPDNRMFKSIIINVFFGSGSNKCSGSGSESNKCSGSGTTDIHGRFSLTFHVYAIIENLFIYCTGMTSPEGLPDYPESDDESGNIQPNSKEAEELLRVEPEEMDTKENKEPGTVTDPSTGNNTGAGTMKTNAATNTEEPQAPPPPGGEHSSSSGGEEDDKGTTSGSGDNNSTLGMFPKVYYNIRSAKNANKSVRILSGCADSINVGSFEANDSVERHSIAQYRHSYLKRQNISSSFKLDTLTCNSCTGTEHRVLHRESERFQARDLVPQAFVLADQNFPAALPVEENGECVKILRIENCSITELVEAFLELTRGYVVPAGTVVMLSSASHLAEVGITAYATEFVSARGKLRSVFGGGLEIIHGLPVPLSGIESISCIRALCDMIDWLTLVSTNTARDIIATRSRFKQLMLVAGSPEASAMPGSSVTSGTSDSLFASEPLRINLPQNMTDTSQAVFCTDPGYLPVRIEPITEELESELLSELILELNTKFLTDLADLSKCEPVPDPEFDPKSYLEGKQLIIMGGSHASRIAGCLYDKELPVVDLSTPGWKISAAAVDSLSIQLQKVLKEEAAMENILVFHLFDNSVYFGTGTDGSKLAPVKIDGRYHIIGDLTCGDRDLFKELFNTITPLLRAGGECRKILLSPLIRYATKPCCDGPGHLVNQLNKLSMRTMLSESPEWLRNLAFFKRIRNFTVVAPHELLADAGDEERIKKSSRRIAGYWEDDLVHMTKTGYTVMAKQLVITIASHAEKNPSKTPSSGSGTGPASWGGISGRRPSWTCSDEAVASRSDVRGRGNGRHMVHKTYGRGGRGGKSYSHRGRWQKPRRGNRGWPY